MTLIQIESLRNVTVFLIMWTTPIGKRCIDGKDERSPYSLQETGDDQYGQRRRCPAEDGAKHEDDQPCFIDGLPPDHIGQASESQQARSNHDQIANDDPFDGSTDANAKGVRNGG